MPIIEIARIQVRRGSEGAAGTGVPQLAPGEFAWAVDTQHLYIGKRMYENGIATGASDDNNVRILTQNDLTSILTQAAQNVTVSNLSTSAYRFNSFASPTTGTSVDTLGRAETLATVGSVYTKLDNFVSITDFSQSVPNFWPPMTHPTNLPVNDITYMLQNAINGVIAQSTGTNGITSPSQHIGPYTIKIPPGKWAVSSPIFLPPYTTIMGEGAGKTIITATNITGYNDAVFQTVDAFGVTYDGSQNISPGYKPRTVRLQGMTIQPQDNNAANFVMLSLDNAENVTIDDVHFGSPYATTSSANVVGISLRNSSIVSDITLSTVKNIKINNCIFNGLTTGILNTGTVDRLTVTESKFSWLTNGLVSYAQAGSVWNINSTIENSMFEYIGAEAMIIGTATNVLQSYVTSENNSFVNVGNNFQSDNTQTNNVITVNDRGFQSQNDYFSRMIGDAGPTVRPLSSSSLYISTSTYQYPWVSGNSAVRGNTFRGTIPANTTTNLLTFPLSGHLQVARIDYNVINPNMSRQGQLVMNIPPSGVYQQNYVYANVTDSYNYIENTPGSSLNLAFGTNPAITPTIANSGLDAYPNGFTVSTTATITENTQTANTTATVSITMQYGSPSYIIAGTTQVTFEQPSAPAFTATVISSVVSGNTSTVVISINSSTFNNYYGPNISTSSIAVVPQTPVILSNSITQWSTTTNNSFTFPYVAAPNNISALGTSTATIYYYTTSAVQAYIYDNSNLSPLLFISSSTYYPTASTSTAYYVLNFMNTSTAATIVNPGDNVQVLVYTQSNKNSNVVTLNCTSIDSNTSTVQLDVTLLS
jgi:hypothetical protein